MSRFHRALSNRMRYKEEIELSILDFRLLDKAGVDVGTLRWVLDELIALLCLSLLEESLTDPLVHNDQSDLRWVNCNLRCFSLRQYGLTCCLSFCL